MNCVSCDICVYHLGLCVFFPGVFLSSRVTGACPVTTDLIMRVNVRTTTMDTWIPTSLSNFGASGTLEPQCSFCSNVQCIICGIVQFGDSA